MHLQQAVDDAASLARLLVDGGQQLGRVDAVNKVDVGRNVFDLVGLQVPDHVPADVLRQLGLLVGHLLHFVLAKVTQAGLVGFADIVGRVCLRHGYQLHAGRQLGFQFVDGFGY